MTNYDNYIIRLKSLQVITPDPYKYFFEPYPIYYHRKKYLQKYVKNGKPNIRAMVKIHPFVIKEIEDEINFNSNYNETSPLYTEKAISNRNPLSLEAHQFRSWFTEQNISYSDFIGEISCEIML